MLDVKEIESKLIGSTFIEKVYYFDEIESTNNFAKTLADEDNVLVITDYQSRGKGRLERTWTSEKYSNLTFSIKKHFDIEHNKIQYVNFFTCCVLFAAIDIRLRSRAGSDNFDLTIKWPNDILLNRRKICGILVESTLPKNDFILGVGININQDSFPEDFSNYAASFRKFLGYDISCEEFLIDIIKLYDESLELMASRNYNKIFKLWKDHNKFIGKDIIFVTNGNIERNAQIIDFLEDGGVKMKIDNKEIVYYSGDIRIVPAS